MAKIYYCENKCPHCGHSGDATDKPIDWELVEVASPITQKATCGNCGCEFQEVHKYRYTIILKKGKKK